MWSQRGAVGIGALLSVLAVVSGLLVGSGNAARVFQLGDGKACMADQIPGGSGVACPSVGSGDRDWRDAGDGAVRRVVVGADGLVWAQIELGDGLFVWRQVGRDDHVDVPGSEGERTSVVTGGGRSWLVSVDSRTVRALGVESDSKKVSSSLKGGVHPIAAVDGDGRLVLVTVSSVVVFDVAHGRVREREAGFRAPHGVSSVVAVGDVVVLVSATDGSAVVIDGETAGRRLDLGLSGKGLKVPALSSGSVLWVLDPETGRVVGTHVDGRRVASVSLPGPGNWQPPVVVGDVVMVSRVVAGRVELWRASAGSSSFTQVPLDGPEVSGLVGCVGQGVGEVCPEVFESGGRLWVNRPSADSVVVVDGSGGVRVLSKGRPAGDGEGPGGDTLTQRGATNAGAGPETLDPPLPGLLLRTSSLGSVVAGGDDGPANVDPTEPKATTGPAAHSGDVDPVIGASEGSSADADLSEASGERGDQPGLIEPDPVEQCPAGIGGSGPQVKRPTPPSNIRISAIPDTRVLAHVVVTWDEPSVPYVCQFSVAIQIGGETVRVIAGSGDRSALLPAVRMGDVAVTVTAVNARGQGQTTVDFHISTPPPTAPSVPTSVHWEQTNGTDRALWLPPEDDGGSPVVDYRLWIHSPDLPDSELNGSYYTILVEDLPTNFGCLNNGIPVDGLRSFYFEVAAENAVGVSDFVKSGLIVGTKCW